MIGYRFLLPAKEEMIDRTGTATRLSRGKVSAPTSVSILSITLSWWS
jgi:hypothetical protein